MTTRGNENMRRKVSVLMLASAVVAVGVGGLRSTARVEDEGSGLSAPIEGTWILSVHRVKQGITFTALESFTAGGVTVATGTIDRTPPPPISPLYGSWTRTSGNNYAAKLCFFFFAPEGNALGMFKNLLLFHVVGKNNLLGSGPGLVCDVNGDHCVDSGDSITITGKRLVAQGSSN